MEALLSLCPRTVCEQFLLCHSWLSLSGWQRYCFEGNFIIARAPRDQSSVQESSQICTNCTEPEKVKLYSSRSHERSAIDHNSGLGSLYILKASASAVLLMPLHSTSALLWLQVSRTHGWKQIEFGHSITNWESQHLVQVWADVGLSAHRKTPSPSLWAWEWTNPLWDADLHTFPGSWAYKQCIHCYEYVQSQEWCPKEQYQRIDESPCLWIGDSWTQAELYEGQ